MHGYTGILLKQHQLYDYTWYIVIICVSDLGVQSHQYFRWWDWVLQMCLSCQYFIWGALGSIFHLAMYVDAGVF